VRVGYYMNVDKDTPPVRVSVHIGGKNTIHENGHVSTTKTRLKTQGTA